MKENIILPKSQYKRYCLNKKNRKRLKKIIKILILFFQLSINISFFYFFPNNKNYQKNFEIEINNINNNNGFEIDYNNNSFAIIRRPDCRSCGLFSYFIIYLGCINECISLGYIPIIDLVSFPNIFNKMNSSISTFNPWEYFFHQPFGYTLEKVKKRAKKIYNYKCSSKKFRPDSNIFYNIALMNFWHNIAKIYVPIKSEILIEAKKIIHRFFKYSKNILGILVRGTDYLAIRPKNHSIPPKPEVVINDIKQLNKKYNYNFFFISTEDDTLREIFIKEFNFKIKYLTYNKKINYNYEKPKLLAYNENILGNIEYSKVYLLNMIILTKCIDIIAAKTSGSIGVFILSNGFRYSKIYELGKY